jgi:hypothetical protein
MITRGRRAGLLTVNDAVDRFVDLLRDARPEHDADVAKVMAEFNAEIAELKRELFAQLDATVVQIKAKFEREVATLQRLLADARAELSKLQMLDASQSGNDTTRLN